jgi:glycosyltransferase involved in cell wall biosynthesis
MIVKNESRVIKRCLDSVKPVIDYWVIVDTGSTDGTQELIKDYLKDIPGELYERPWRNFGENRSEAFELAKEAMSQKGPKGRFCAPKSFATTSKEKGDYILFMDADDILEFKESGDLPSLTLDLYNMWRGTQEFSYLKPQIVRADLPWKWIGVTHEYLDCPEAYTSDILQTVRYVTGDGGASTYDPNKFLKNIKLLTEGLKKEPQNSRYAFYLAESYRDAGKKAKALEWYQKRVNMGGWDEEIFWSALQIGHMLRDLGLPVNIVIEAYKNAHLLRFHRLEPIYYLAERYNQMGDYNKAYEILKTKDFIPRPAEKDMLFNEDWIEEYGLLFQLSICSYYVGNYEESLDICNRLIAMKNLPETWREQAKKNRIYPLAKLQEKKDVAP